MTACVSRHAEVTEKLLLVPWISIPFSRDHSSLSWAVGFGRGENLWGTVPVVFEGEMLKEPCLEFYKLQHPEDGQYRKLLYKITSLK